MQSRPGSAFRPWSGQTAVRTGRFPQRMLRQCPLPAVRPSRPCRAQPAAHRRPCSNGPQLLLPRPPHQAARLPQARDDRSAASLWNPATLRMLAHPSPTATEVPRRRIRTPHPRRRRESPGLPNPLPPRAQDCLKAADPSAPTRSPDHAHFLRQHSRSPRNTPSVPRKHSMTKRGTGRPVGSATPFDPDGNASTSIRRIRRNRPARCDLPPGHETSLQHHAPHRRPMSRHRRRGACRAGGHGQGRRGQSAGAVHLSDGWHLSARIAGVALPSAEPAATRPETAVGQDCQGETDRTGRRRAGYSTRSSAVISRETSSWLV